jgi:hypothetical protein
MQNNKTFMPFEEVPLHGANICSGAVNDKFTTNYSLQDFRKCFKTCSSVERGIFRSRREGVNYGISYRIWSEPAALKPPPHPPSLHSHPINYAVIWQLTDFRFL